MNIVLSPILRPSFQALVLLATLASVEMFDGIKPPPQLLHKFTTVRVAPDGLCLWSCLWLAKKAYMDDVVSWFHRPRSEGGFALGADCRREAKVVFNWACGLEDMPASCRERLEKRVSAEEEDLDTWLT